MIEVIILAAGKGTRMRSALPKVLHRIGGKPMVDHVVATAKSLSPARIHLVIGHGAEQLREHVGGDADIRIVEQREQLGTGHAALQVSPQLNADSTTLILYGDVPLIRKDTLVTLLGLANKAQTVALLTVNLDEPSGYGRIVRNETGEVQYIVEQKDADVSQLGIKEVNTGVIAARSSDLARWLPQLKNSNVQGEFYLTDIIAMAVGEGLHIATTQPADDHEVMGINNRQQQAELERAHQQRQALVLMQNGLALLDPSRFDLRGQLEHGADCHIDINCVLEGRISLGNNVTIAQNCYIKNAIIGDKVEILSNSVIEDVDIGAGAHVGPFARLRPGTKLANNARVGNFVEIKNAEIGVGSKVNHLSYVGDAQLGSNVNIGAGTITCNYDGANKHRTTIEDEVFVGSNSALVAPVTLEKGATVAAGSTITQSVPENGLALARSRQRVVEGWQRPKKK